MDLIKQILASFEGTLPNDSKTAAALEVAICRLEALPLNGARAK